VRSTTQKTDRRPRREPGRRQKDKPGKSDTPLYPDLHRKIELGQQYDGEWHGIYGHPDNVLKLVHAVLRMAGMGDLQLYREVGGSGHMSACEDVEWPEQSREFGEISEASERKLKDRTAAERQRRRRVRLRDERGSDERDSNRDIDRGTTTEEPELKLVAAG
jgi:hypothetical protein